MAERKPRSRSPSPLSELRAANPPRPRAALYALLFTFSFLIITYNLFSIPFSYSLSSQRLAASRTTASAAEDALPSPTSFSFPGSPTQTARVEHRTFGRHSGVYCYPSRGGITILEIATPVELDFLGIPRTDVNGGGKYDDPEKEDVFCGQMMKLGAKWWKSYNEYEDVLMGARRRTNREAEKVLVGWPEGRKGAWVLKWMTANDEPDDMGRVGNARDMEERCKVLEEAGAKWCEEPEKCLDLSIYPEDNMELDG